MKCFAGEEFKYDYKSTIGVDFKICTVELNGIEIRLQLWDTNGHHRFGPLVTPYYRGATGIIITYSVTNFS